MYSSDYKDERTDADLSVAILRVVSSTGTIGSAILGGGVGAVTEAVLGAAPTRHSTGAPALPGGPGAINCKKYTDCFLLSVELGHFLTLFLQVCNG